MGFPRTMRKPIVERVRMDQQVFSCGEAAIFHGALKGTSKKGKVRDQEEQVGRERWVERAWNFTVSHRTLLPCFLRHRQVS